VNANAGDTLVLWAVHRPHAFRFHSAHEVEARTTQTPCLPISSIDQRRRDGPCDALSRSRLLLLASITIASQKDSCMLFLPRTMSPPACISQRDRLWRVRKSAQAPSCPSCLSCPRQMHLLVWRTPQPLSAVRGAFGLVGHQQWTASNCRFTAIICAHSLARGRGFC
jgi:hypothetical protein